MCFRRRRRRRSSSWKRTEWWHQRLVFRHLTIFKLKILIFKLYLDEEETDSCQKSVKRKSGAIEVEPESEESSEKKAKLDDAEEDPATAEPQFVEA